MDVHDNRKVQIPHDANGKNENHKQHKARCASIRRCFKAGTSPLAAVGLLFKRATTKALVNVPIQKQIVSRSFDCWREEDNGNT